MISVTSCTGCEGVGGDSFGLKQSLGGTETRDSNRRVLTKDIVAWVQVECLPCGQANGSCGWSAVSAGVHSRACVCG